jgi:hypothetical protein
MPTSVKLWWFWRLLQWRPQIKPRSSNPSPRHPVLKADRENALITLRLRLKVGRGVTVLFFLEQPRSLPA